MICRADALISWGSGRCCKYFSVSRAEPWWGPGGKAPGSSEDLAVDCIENGPKVHPRGAYCLITFRQILGTAVHAGSKHATEQIINFGAMTVTLPLFSMLDKIKNLQKLNYTQNSISKILSHSWR